MSVPVSGTSVQDWWPEAAHGFPAEKLDAFLRAVGTSTVMEAVRSGVSGIGRGDKILSL